MKRVVYNNLQDVVAMSLINPKLCKEYGIYVEVEQGGEGSIPHVHVYHDRTRDPHKCSYIRLDKPEYSDHHEQPSPKLSKQLKSKFIDVMKSDWNKFIKVGTDGISRPITGYEFAVDTWVETYEDDYSKFTFDANGSLVMPDYNLL